MKAFASGTALALFLLCAPLAAEEAADPPPSAATANPATAPAVETAREPQAAAAETAPPSPAAAPPVEGAPAAPATAPVVDPAPPAPPPPPPITLVLDTNLGTQRLTVIENGKTRYVWPISSGRRGYATQTGTFRPQWASRMWYSRQYEYSPMPHAVFFHRGTAFHGTGAVGMLGQPASHGCVRLAPGNAAILFRLVHKHSFAQTKVVVHHGGRRKGPAVARGSRSEQVSTRSNPRSQRSARARRGYYQEN
jgi:lipoprotein-anchoring transpeptidase ErfK/SrfK